MKNVLSHDRIPSPLFEILIARYEGAKDCRLHTGKLILTSVPFSRGFVLRDLSSAPFETRSCMGEKLI